MQKNNMQLQVYFYVYIEMGNNSIVNRIFIYPLYEVSLRLLPNGFFVVAYNRSHSQRISALVAGHKH